MEMIKVYMIDLPCTVYGLTTYFYDDDGQVYYTIFINAKMSAEKQCQTYDHEISHIDHGDFEHMQRVDELELVRHKMYA